MKGGLESQQDGPYSTDDGDWAPIPGVRLGAFEANIQASLAEPDAEALVASATALL